MRDEDKTDDWTHQLHDKRYKIVNGVVFYHTQSCPFLWEKSDRKPENITEANGFIKRHIPSPLWDRAKLPPIGTKCEVLYGGIWAKCEVMTYVTRTTRAPEMFAVVQMANEWALFIEPDNFRESKTDRQKAVEAMMIIFEGHGGFRDERMGALYDSGYRKPDYSVK